MPNEPSLTYCDDFSEFLHAMDNDMEAAERFLDFLISSLSKKEVTVPSSQAQENE